MTANEIKQAAQNIREAIADNRVDDAFRLLKELAQHGSKDDAREVVLLGAQHKDLVRKTRAGLMSDSDARMEERRQLHSALSLTDDLEERLMPKEAVVKAPTVKAPLTEATAPQLQKIIGINNLKQIAWLRRGLEASRAVCRIHTPGGMGTGFLIGPRHVMTNNHVIATPETARKAKIEFNYENDLTSNEVTARYELNPSGFFKTSDQFELDYTVVEIKVPKGTGVPITKWGHVTLNATADPLPDEHVVIVQHPNGQPKQIALTANAVLRTKSPMLHYTTDTMPGSSGSPVFNDLWQVVAIHHAEGPPVYAEDGTPRHTNEGILMSAIVPDLGDGWRKAKR